MGVLLVVGTVGVGALDGSASDSGLQTAAADAGAAIDAEAATADVAELQNESSENNTSVPPNRTVEVFRVTENQTNGTVVGAKLRSKQSAELGSAKFVYELDVLADNGSHLVAEVYATNATVIGVESANDSDGFFDDLFGSDDGVPDEARNTSRLRSATEAVRLAVNETEVERANLTVTEVVLDVENETLVYKVNLIDASGEPHEVVVAANENEGDIVTTDPNQIGGVFEQPRRVNDGDRGEPRTR